MNLIAQEDPLNDTQTKARKYKEHFVVVCEADCSKEVTRSTQAACKSEKL